MKLLIVSGTPKSDGLCQSLVAAAETAARSAEVETVKLSDYRLQGCRMCGDGWGDCNKTHRCAHGDEDGFNGLQEKCRDADAFVWITPVYWGETSEAMKCFPDRLRRCQATKQWSNEKNDKSFLEGKTFIVVASAGGSGNGIVNAFSQMERAVSHMKGSVYDFIGVNRWNQAYKREALKEAVASLIANGGMKQ